MVACSLACSATRKGRGGGNEPPCGRARHTQPGDFARNGLQWIGSGVEAEKRNSRFWLLCLTRGVTWAGPRPSNPPRIETTSGGWSGWPPQRPQSYRGSLGGPRSFCMARACLWANPLRNGAIASRRLLGLATGPVLALRGLTSLTAAGALPKYVKYLDHSCSGSSKSQLGCSFCLL